MRVQISQIAENKILFFVLLSGVTDTSEFVYISWSN